MSDTERASPFEVPPTFQSVRSALPDEVIIIAWWDDEQSRNITVQDFHRDGEAYIPVFTDETTFKTQSQGSGFEDRAVSINSDLLLSILGGGELLIINPNGEKPLAMRLPER